MLPGMNSRLQILAFIDWKRYTFSAWVVSVEKVSWAEGRYAIWGPLMAGPQCRLSILRNVNVPCHYLLDSPVDFKIVQCRLSILRNGNVPCR